MPKKPSRNAYYYFMLEFKEEQRKKGIHYANMNEVSAAAGPIYQDAPPAVRKKFEEIAKREKQKILPDNKYTSQGVPIAVIDRRENETKKAAENERNDIMNMVTNKGLGHTVINLDIFVMDINCYCKTNEDYIVGEFAVLHFTIEHGIVEVYHTMINPSNIPMGYTADIKAGRLELGLDMPDESKPRTDYISLLATTIDYLKKNLAKKEKKIPALFTMPDKVAQVTNFIQQMCRRAGEDDTIFRVYQLDKLFVTLTNYVRTSESDGFPKESLALDLLKKDLFKYTPGLACQHHETIDKPMDCCLSRVKRWAYTILDTVCPVIGIPAEPGKHLPADFDLTEIQSFQEQKKARLPPTVAVKEPEVERHIPDVRPVS
nr:protein maelstrom homolog [Maniola hyperantus]